MEHHVTIRICGRQVPLPTWPLLGLVG